jgi:hypothetical protein
LIPERNFLTVVRAAIASLCVEEEEVGDDILDLLNERILIF